MKTGGRLDTLPQSSAKCLRALRQAQGIQLAALSVDALAAATLLAAFEWPAMSEVAAATESNGATGNRTPIC
ncbi:hypothetical protein BH09PLA1_BH09PLA1_36980 [soil metagenome]